MSKILVIGDPHLRIEEEVAIQHYIQSIQSIITDNKPDIIILLGDILHNHEKIHSGSMKLAISLFNVCRKEAKTFCLVGNHDAINNQIFLSDDHWMNGCKELHNFTVVDRVTIYTHNGIQLCMIPYVPDGRFKEALQTSEDWDTSHFLFSHQLFDGCKMGSIVANSVEEYPDDYPICFNGHIHPYQKVKDNLYCVGSSRPVGYADTQSKKCILITSKLNKTDTGCKCKIKEIPIYNLIKRTIHVDYNSTGELQLDNIDSNSGIKYVVKGTQEELKCFKKTKMYQVCVDKHIPVQLKVKEESKQVEETNDITPTLHFFDRLRNNIEDNPNLVSFYNELEAI